LQRFRQVGVDPDAVRLGLATRSWLRKLAQTAQYRNDPAMLVDAFVRGFCGDPLGTFADLRAADVEIESELQSLQSLDTRAIQSSRYGFSF
jgi:hypothetical protein